MTAVFASVRPAFGRSARMVEIPLDVAAARAPLDVAATGRPPDVAATGRPPDVADPRDVAERRHPRDVAETRRPRDVAETRCSRDGGIATGPFSKAVVRMASRLGLAGEVHDGATGVAIRLSGPEVAIDAFRALLGCEPPPVTRTGAMTETAPPPAPGLARGEAVEEAIGAAVALLRRGEIVTIQGSDGSVLVCDATHAPAVSKLRGQKRLDSHAFPLMARDAGVIREYCTLSADEERELASSRAPIVLLALRQGAGLPDDLAPGLATLGFMLPATPLHALLLRDIDFPLAMTGGDRLPEPPAHVMCHEGPLAHGHADSVVRWMDGEPRVLRRARGYSPIGLPEGFGHAPDLLALGGDRDAAFCLLRDGEAIPSFHLGQLDDCAAYDEYRGDLALWRDLFGHAQRAVAADMDPDCHSAKLARTMRRPVLRVQHHHAHVASCLCENGYPLDEGRVLGIVLDGAGWGTDGTFWGGEFMLADYRGYRRLAALKPVAMTGPCQSVREPWRDLYAHIAAAIGWDVFRSEYPGLESLAWLNTRPHRTLDAMISKQINAPLCSSAACLFDAVAAALGLCSNRQSHTGQAAARLEAIAFVNDPDETAPDETGYDFAATRFVTGLRVLDPAPMWHALFSDLRAGEPVSRIAARFHAGLARALAETAAQLARTDPFRVVTLTGSCFENRPLLEQTTRRLTEAGFVVLTQSHVPSGDGGLALGQAAVAAAWLMPKNGARVAVGG